MRGVAEMRNKWGSLGYFTLHVDSGGLRGFGTDLKYRCSLLSHVTSNLEMVENSILN